MQQPAWDMLQTLENSIVQVSTCDRSRHAEDGRTPSFRHAGAWNLAVLVFPHGLAATSSTMASLQLPLRRNLDEPRVNMALGIIAHSNVRDQVPRMETRQLKLSAPGFKVSLGLPLDTPSGP